MSSNIIKFEGYYDRATGNVYNQQFKDFKIFDDKKGYLFKAKAYQKRMYNEILLSDVVSDINDFARVHLLAEMIYKNTNCICIRLSKRNIRPATIQDISNKIKYSSKRTKDFIKQMKDRHVIAERVDKIGNEISTKYYMNPLFFNSNKYIHADLYFLFEKSLKHFIPEWVKMKFHEIGVLNNDKHI